MARPDPDPAMTRHGPVLVALYTWLLPFAVAAAGFGVHYALHVPKGPLPPPSPTKVEEERKAKEKAKKEEDRKQREADRKAGKKPAKPEKVERVKEFPYEAFTRPREPYLMSQLWQYYEPIDFKKEPTFEAWQTAHKPVLAQIVQSARTVAFAEPPPVSAVGTECHTVRCRFSLTSEDEAALADMTAVLRDLQYDGGPLWHDFAATKPAKDKKDGDRLKVTVTVSLMRDLPRIAGISVPGKGNLSAIKPPVVPAKPATPAAPSGKAAPGAAPTGADQVPARPGARKPAEPAESELVAPG